MRKGRTPASLNIKDAETYALAREVSELAGESMTSAVKQALRDRRERLQNRKRRASVTELLAIADRASVHVRRPYADHAELLYDENGLPK
ncbi:MAG: type II toxin-antitoxin system VapB family antitoxin [Acidobacteria bacterium]|nr:type II toxin-antitoxin system VapB family antitoxin [Acidobacteriota bacterium]